MNSNWNPPPPIEGEPSPPPPSSPTSFSAEAVFYDAPGGTYLVNTGRSFFRWSRKAPVVNGVARWRIQNGDDPEVAQKNAKRDLSNRELDGAVQWSGAIAGHARGLHHDTDGMPILIISQANLPEPAAGSFPTISDIIAQGFPDQIPHDVFTGWLATRFRAVAAGVHTPGPMMVLAGQVNTGKSLLAWLVGQTLGGRTASPHAAWSGGMLWNDDLVGAELLLIDDAVSSTNIQARRNLGSAFKEANYGPAVQLRKRHASSISVRPVWSIMICCNSTPEALQVIPPLNDDLEDKVILLRAAPIRPPVDTSRPEGRLELQRLIRAELPAFVGYLSTFTIPEDLHDSRSGIRAWRDPDLEDAIGATSPERRLEELLGAAIGNRGIWHDLPATLSAAEIEGRMTDHQSGVRDQARALFSWPNAAGTYLARLARSGSDHVSLADPDKHRKVLLYHVRP